MNSSKIKQLIGILKESPLFSTLTSKEYASLIKHIEEYPPYGDPGDESANIGYEASWLFLNSAYRKSTAGH